MAENAKIQFMKIKQINTGILVSGKEVIEVEMINSKGTLVSIYNYGAIIHRFVVKNAKGDKQDIVLGFDEFQSYISPDYLNNYCYFGAAIGRYANRIGGGRFQIDGQDIQVAQNKGSDALHGGFEGFDKKVWDIIEVTETPMPKVVFQYYSQDGEEGHPGDLAVQLAFQLTETDELILTYTADTDEATAINLTHHSYFNLSPTVAPIMDHVHQMNAANWLEQDAGYIVTGKVLPVEGTVHDFRTPKPIGLHWNAQEGYDQTYVLDKAYGEMGLASKTTETNSGLSLLVYTTEPVAHLYTAKYVDVKNGKNGKNYGEFSAFCVETQHHPNAVNIPEFPNTVLQPDVQYHQTTIYKVILNS